MDNTALLLAGIGIGVVFGLFGAGGSAFATPILALIGVPGVAAVASPLPAMLPAALVGARRALRTGSLDLRLAGLAVAAGLPGAVAGALASSLVAGHALLLMSGVMLLAVGARMLMPDPVDHATRCEARRNRRSLVLSASFGVGVLTGLLANGGGFLLVPLFVVVFGLTSRQAAGTSMLAVGALTVPTLITHSALGHVDWHVALLFALGMLPGSLAGAQLGQRISAERVRRAFGVVLLLFAGWFLVHQGL
ncbi:MAG TPA: sulfite exporter TauE/SafE family protein [Acidimicrobiales bacterium]|nr:sulfite exporter TauE/SafE family protein [Acidimicrobiales bacterium]